MNLVKETGKNPGALLPVLLFFCSSLALLSVSRLVMALWQWQRVAAVDGFSRVMLNGVRMDLQIVGYVTLPLLLGTLLVPASRYGRLWSRFQTVWMVVWFGLFIYMECATPSFINYYDVRPNRLFIEYLDNPREVGLTLWADYKFQIMLSLLAVTLGSFLFYRLLRTTTAAVRPWGWKKRIILLPIVIVVVAIGARGSLDHRPANPGTAAFSSDHLVNDLAVSSAYSVLYALYSLRHEGDAGETYIARMSTDEINSRMHQMMRLPDAAFTDPTAPTMHRSQPERTCTRPMNLVIILEESLGAQYVASLGGEPYTPELEKLSRQGIWFDNLYATGTRSVRGIEAVVTGFLPTPGRSVVKLGLSQNNFFTLPELFRKQGYDTEFIYGGESQFDNMRGFFLNNGFNRVIDQKDYKNPVFRGTWGVSDEDLFNRADAELTAADKPLFALVFTSSNHPPHEYPAGRIKPIDGEKAKIANAVRYADYALGQFFDKARSSPYWENTIFLVVADHDDVLPGPDLVPVEHFHIPGLILGGSIAAQKISILASQVDLGPTVLSLMGVEVNDPMPGISLLDPPANYSGRAILQYGTIHALMRNNQVAVLQPDKPGTVFNYSNGHLRPNVEGNEELLRDAVATAFWPSLAYRTMAYHPDKGVLPHLVPSARGDGNKSLCTN